MIYMQRIDKLSKYDKSIEGIRSIPSDRKFQKYLNEPLKFLTNFDDMAVGENSSSRFLLSSK